MARFNHGYRDQDGPRSSLDAAVAALAARQHVASEAERRFLSLCRAGGLPAPRPALIAGRQVDFYWPRARLAVEVDGAAYHHTRRAFHEDRSRDLSLATLGIQVLA